MTATILVVDDNENNIKLLEAKLLSEYYTVYSAYSGHEAIRILKEKEIDVILLDVMMPGIDGFETCNIIKSDPNTMNIPIIMITAIASEDRVKGLEAGADEFLSKPINEHALIARVKSLTRMKSIFDELRNRNKSNQALGQNQINFSNDFSECEVLIIDEDPVQSSNIKTYLETITKKIKIINDTEVIDSKYFPDLVIFNFETENKDPLRLFVNLKLRENLRYASFILLCDEVKMPDVLKGLELGANDYCEYPVDRNEIVARVKTQLKRKKYQDELRKNIDQNLSLSIKDSLTNTYNRRYFDTYLKQVIEEHREKNKKFGLLMLDIDNFKIANDTYGHLAGDNALKIFAKILNENIRVNDFIARYGGEEFVIVITDTTEEIIENVAERIRSKIESAKFKVSDNCEINLTSSIGISIFNKDELPEELISKSDKALYQAKNTGKNKIVIIY